MTRWAGNRVMQLRALMLHPGVPCGLCGHPIPDVRDAQLDHIVPRSRGGTDAMSNLTPTHRACNLRKGAGLGRRPATPPAIIAMPRDDR